MRKFFTPEYREYRRYVEKWFLEKTRKEFLEELKKYNKNIKELNDYEKSLNDYNLHILMSEFKYNKEFLKKYLKLRNENNLKDLQIPQVRVHIRFEEPEDLPEKYKKAKEEFRKYMSKLLKKYIEN